MTEASPTPFGPDSIQVGVVFPQLEIGAIPSDIARYATTVEALGFRHLLAYDHVVGGALDEHPELKGRYTSDSMFHEIFVLFGYLAALTSSLEFVSGVLILPQRQTTLVAKQAAEIDVLSGGRLRVGVGIGWNAIEYEALNEAFSNRARRFEEQIALLRAFWRENILDFHGDYHTVDHAGILPMPIQQPIPLWIGASAEPAVRRAARLGDGYLATTPIGPNLDAILGWLNDELERNGRSPRTFGLEGRIGIAHGNEDDWKREFAFWQEAGATHVSFNTMGETYDGVDAHLAALERALRAVEGM
ncbi:MAG: LLM class F420-dependent oxidoreductase [Thermomicrobiales bacterium]